MSDARARSKLEEAVRAGERRDYKTAVRLLEDLLSRHDYQPEALLYLGRALHALGDYGRAIAAFSDYLRCRPKSAAGRLFAGRSYLALGFPRRAIPLLEQAARLKPLDPDIMGLLGIACLKARRSAHAVVWLERAVKAAPDNQRIYRAYLNALLVRGIRLSRSGDSDLGAQMLRFVLANGMDAVLPRLELGRIYRESGALEDALDHYTAAATLEPGDAQIRWYRASLLMALDRSSEAASELQVLKSLGADVPELSWNAELVDRFLIRELLSRSEWRRAATACGAWLRKRGDDPSIHGMFAEALRGAGDYETAENHARRAIAGAPGEAGPHYALVLILWQKEDWKALAAELSAARRNGCDEDTLLSFRALLASRTDEDDKKVIELIQTAIRSSGPAPELMFSLAERYFRIGLPELSENWYRKVLSIEGGHERAWLGLIASAETLAAGSEEAAVRLQDAYRDYLERFPDNIDIAREFAVLLFRKKIYAEAAGRLEILLAWDASNPKLRRLLAYAYRKTSRYREAAVLLKGLLKERPKDTALLLELAQSLDKAGGRAYAIALLKNALPIVPAAGEPALVLGVLLEKSGKKEAALDAFREAAARNPADPRPFRRMEALYRSSGIREFADRYAAEAEKRERRTIKKS